MCFLSACLLSLRCLASRVLFHVDLLSVCRQLNIKHPEPEAELRAEASGIKSAAKFPSQVSS